MKLTHVIFACTFAISVSFASPINTSGKADYSVNLGGFSAISGIYPSISETTSSPLNEAIPTLTSSLSTDQQFLYDSYSASAASLGSVTPKVTASGMASGNAGAGFNSEAKVIYYLVVAPAVSISMIPIPPRLSFNGDVSVTTSVSGLGGASAKADLNVVTLGLDYPLYTLNNFGSFNTPVSVPYFPVPFDLVGQPIEVVLDASVQGGAGGMIESSPLNMYGLSTANAAVDPTFQLDPESQQYYTLEFSPNLTTADQSTAPEPASFIEFGVGALAMSFAIKRYRLS